MKTTKKGFTLIELIVVIAIIGVLAAILVPAMLGYVKKSKIQAANADAKTMLTNINAALEELDEEGVKISASGWNDNNITTTTTAAAADWTEILKRAKEYSDTITTAHFSVYIKEGAAVAAVAKSGKYYGTYPAGLTNKNYNSTAPTSVSASPSSAGLGSDPTLNAAKTYACAVYNNGRDSGSYIGGATSSSTT